MSKTAVVVDVRSNAGQDSSMRKENRRKGFTLVLTGACIVSLFGMLGLSVDLGRVYITKSETQSFADTGALAGALALNGTSFVSARDAVTGNNKNQWNMGTAMFTESGGNTTITIEFALPQAANLSQPDASTWSAEPPTAAGYTFIRVTASAILPLYILPVVGTSRTQLVKAVATAGQTPLFNFGSGLLPFSPVYHASAATTSNPAGMTVGGWYTLRYPGGATFKNSDLCNDDRGDAVFLALANLQPSSERGFYQNPSASVADQEIIDGLMQYPVVFPGTISMYGGAMNTAQNALNQRIDFDTDHVSNTYDQYQNNQVNGVRVGNGFRLVGTPANAGPPSSSGGVRQIVGFVGMFLSSGPTGDVHYSSGGGSPWCAQYYGIWNKNGQTTGAGKPGIAYVTVMVQ